MTQTQSSALSCLSLLVWMEDCVRKSLVRWKGRSFLQQNELLVDMDCGLLVFRLVSIAGVLGTTKGWALRLDARQRLSHPTPSREDMIFTLRLIAEKEICSSIYGVDCGTMPVDDMPK